MRYAAPMLERSFAVFALSWLLSACLGDDGGMDSCPIADVDCDIREAACQRSIYQATACTGQMHAAEQPPVRTIELDALEAELRAEMTPDDPDAERTWSLGLQLIGLLPQGMNASDAVLAVALDDLAAYYDDVDKRVTVVDRDSNASPQESAFVLSHELTHALRDADTDLSQLREQYATSTDSFAAVASLVEGEAMLVSTAVLVRATQRPSARPDFAAAGERLQASVLDGIARSDVPFFTAAQELPYAFGTKRLGPAWNERGRDVLDALYAQPDRSLLQWVGPLSPPLEGEALSCYPTTPPDGYEPADSDTLGLAALVALPIALDTGDADSALATSRAWRDDRMVLFRPIGADTGARAVVWRVHFDSAAHAQAFGDSIGCCLPAQAKRIQDDRDVLIYAATDPAVTPAWTAVTTCGSEQDLPVAQPGATGMGQGALKLSQKLMARRGKAL
jgi:hypothetical protein